MSVKESQKNSQISDWHRADIIAALHKNGWSLRQLAFSHGYSSASALAQALLRSFPKGESIIANAIGVEAKTIWPTRFKARLNRKRFG